MNKEDKKQLKSSERTAKKIFEVWNNIDDFDDEDVGNLKRVARALKEQNDSLRAVGGVLVNLDKSNYKIEVNELRIKRTNALLALIENKLGKKDSDLGTKYLKKSNQSAEIEKAFGL